jgi:hypothetical protein
VDVEIRPEPQAEEREAILRAVEELVRDSGPSSHSSAWREHGIRENVDESAFEEPS